MRRSRVLRAIPLVLAAATVAAGAAGILGHPNADEGIVRALVVFGWTFLVILGCAFVASAQADRVAHRLGEPYGTLVLTLSAISIEVAVVAAVMLTGHGGPTVARDTMFATLMIILNGLTGVALLVGGWRRHEQFFNLQSSGAYLPLLIAMASIALVVPRFTNSAAGGRMGPWFQVFVAFASIVVYGAFLWLQTSRYRAFFVSEDPADGEGGNDPGDAPAEAVHAHPSGSPWRDAAGLLVALVAVVLLAESLGERATSLIDRSGAPPALSGLLVASLILAPEGLAAVRAARDNSMQRTINILLGSALSTIGLTVPAVLLLAIFLHKDVELGLEPTELALLASTILVAMTSLLRGRVNPMQGLVHLMFFLAWVVLIFD